MKHERLRHSGWLFKRPRNRQRYLFSHSIFFVPIGALVAALILWPFLRTRLGFGRLYLFAFLGYSLSGVLDACTSYGTHLFWPLSGDRVAWNLIAIIDPIFTLALLAAVIVALVKRTPHIAWIGLAFAGLYLSLGWIQQCAIPCHRPA